MTWTARTNKAFNRDLILNPQHGFAGRQMHTAIVMPGWDNESQVAGSDIRTGIKFGTIDPHREIIAVERDHTIAPLIERDLRALGLHRLRMHAASLHMLDLSNTRVDFAFIDLLGSFTENDIVWVRDVLRPSLTEGARLAITVAANPRNNMMMDSIRRQLDKGQTPLLQSLAAPFFAAMQSMREASKSILPSDGYFIAPLILTIAALYDREVRPEMIQPYRDGTANMLTIRLTIGRTIRSATDSLLDAILTLANDNKRILANPVEISAPIEGEGPLVRLGNGMGGFFATARTHIVREPDGRLTASLTVLKGGLMRFASDEASVTERAISEAAGRRRKQEALVAKGFVAQDGTIIRDLPICTPWAAGELVAGTKVSGRVATRRQDMNQCWMLVNDLRQRSLAQWLNEDSGATQETDTPSARILPFALVA